MITFLEYYIWLVEYINDQSLIYRHAQVSIKIKS